MKPTKEQKRAYSSSRRQLQAAQTRTTILEAARKLFYERGFPNSSIDSIAKEAGVASETIYAIFGNKQEILLRLVQITLVGDDTPVPLLERPFIKDALKETDQKHLIEKFAKDMHQIMTRMSPIFSLLRTTAKLDSEIANLQTKLLQERLGGMAFFVEQLNRIGPLRDQILPEQANVTVWALSSAEIFDLLTHDHGWSEEQYITWLRDSLERVLLP